MTQEIFNRWLNNIIKIEEPGNEIVAYYFGIFETQEGYETYLVGSKEFDENDDDWACNSDFEPADKYLKLGQPEKAWEQILEEVKNYIRNYSNLENFKKSFLARSKAISTGFDGGDLFRII